ncbi:hypothetical protein ACIRPK_20730 [Kitasatospora sp. NPDC101801]|uniref:hypothetical protein n=1 Tax=Kitasatospora sp. NPDC101801 TaxID=3364103 RepID=UPI003800544F
MTLWQYAIGLLLVLATLAATVVTVPLLVHERARHDHGPTCRWCRPRPGRR